MYKRRKLSNHKISKQNKVKRGKGDIAMISNNPGTQDMDEENKDQEKQEQKQQRKNENQEK